MSSRKAPNADVAALIEQINELVAAQSATGAADALPNEPTAAPTATPSPKKPVSERKLEANRANARKSTGPRTPEGKARSSQNAYKHGLLARCIIPANDPVEDPADFDSLIQAIIGLIPLRLSGLHMAGLFHPERSRGVVRDA